MSLGTSLIFFYAKYPILYILLVFPIIVLFESFRSSEGDTLAMTYRTFVYIFFHFFSDFLWFELYCLNYLVTVTAVKSNISPLRIKVIFTFFSK